MQFDIPESPIQTLKAPLLSRHNITLKVKRDDLLHPIIQGNKWRKLKYNLKYLATSGKKEFLTFSGPFSNHLYACSMAAKAFNLTGHVILRGPTADFYNPTIKMAKSCGLTIHPVSRQTYRQRNELAYLASLNKAFPQVHIIPEGGSNHLALQGVKELGHALPESDFICCAVGSGGTLAGLIDSVQYQTYFLGVAVLKGADYLHNEVSKLSASAGTLANWSIDLEGHCGGYGKVSHELSAFCHSLKDQLPLEPIYTGKLFYRLWQLIEQGYFPSGSTITAIHTGGLQGLDGLRYMNQR